MKIFSCLNKDCEAHKPNDGATNKVLEEIKARSKLDEDGNPREDIDPILVDTYYVCGFCEDDVKVVPLEKIMKIELLGVKDAFVYGTFYNKLRSQPFKFRINLKSGDVEFAELKSVKKAEVEFIKEEFTQGYKDKVNAEVVDVEQDKYMDKTYEVVIENPVEEREFTIFVKDDKIIDAPKEANGVELNKAKMAVRNSPF